MIETRFRISELERERLDYQYAIEDLTWLSGRANEADEEAGS